jgi:hypothetical protein
MLALKIIKNIVCINNCFGSEYSSQIFFLFKLKDLVYRLNNLVKIKDTKKSCFLNYSNDNKSAILHNFISLYFYVKKGESRKHYIKFCFSSFQVSNTFNIRNSLLFLSKAKIYV